MPIALGRELELAVAADPGALGDLAELLVGEPERVQLPLGAILDEAGLVELHPGGALRGQFLDHLGIDLDQRLDQAERVEALVDAVGGLREQQEAHRTDQHRHRVDPELLLGLGVLIEGLGRGEREPGARPELGDDVVVVRVEPLGHLHCGDVDVVRLPPARHREVGVEVDLAPLPAVPLGDGADQSDCVEHLVVVGEVVGRNQVDPGILHQPPVLYPDVLGCLRELRGRGLALPIALGRELELAVAADPGEA